jgi:murein DD-endopeptidase MepM/ murein hydrolase activator NlpD
MITFINRFVSIFVSFLLCFSLMFGTPFISKAQSKRSELNQRLSGIKDQIRNSSNQVENLENTKKDLQTQVATLQAEIKALEGLIKQTELLLSELETQIPLVKNQIEQTNQKIYKVYKELQYLSTKSSFEQILESGDFGELVGNMYGFSTAQQNLNDLEKQLETQLAKLEEQKNTQQEAKKAQLSTQYSLNSKKSALDRTVLETQNKQEEYQKLLDNQRSEAKTVQDELNSLPEDYKSYIFNNGGNPNGVSNGGPCYFYENRELIYPTGYFAEPTIGSWTDNFNCYPWSFYWRRNGHDGIDIANGYGTPIVSTAPGIVDQIYTIQNAGAYGLSIKHTLPSGQRVYSVYWHLNRLPVVRVGQVVERSQYIGEMGSTGFSTGPHLHFMIVSDTYEQYGIGCSYGNRRAKCYNPARLIGWE